MGKKKVILAFTAAFLVFVFQFVDVFFIHTTGSFLGSNVVARIVGIVVVVIFSVAVKANVGRLCLRTYSFFAEMINGTIFAVVPAALVFGAEYLILKYKSSPHLMINIDFPNTNDEMSIKGKLFAVAVFAATVFLQSIFKELVFRGYMITQLNEKFKIGTSIVIQAVLYMLLLVPTIANMLLTGRFTGYGIKMTLFIIAGNMIIDFISGLKWGLFFRVSGNVWMSTADHFANNMILTCFAVYADIPMKWYVIQAIAMQVVSLLMFIPVYFKRDKLNEEIAAEVAVQRELAGMHVDNYSPSPTRHYIENRRRLKQEEMARKRNMPIPPDARIPFPTELEEPVSLAEMKLNAATEFLKTINNDGDEIISEQSDDVVNMDFAPSEMSKRFFDSVIDRSIISNAEDFEKRVEEARQVEEARKIEEAKRAEEARIAEEERKAKEAQIAEKARKAEEARKAEKTRKAEEKSAPDTPVKRNISKYVQGYFDDNFNKHTFKK